MKQLLTVLAAAAGFVLAAPVHADPEPEPDATVAENPVFLTALRQVGITFTDADQVITAGKAVCGLAGSGESGLELLNDIRAANPALTINGAAQFATIAAKSYCPHQLQASGTAAK